jgi:hypothetical protein
MEFGRGKDCPRAAAGKQTMKKIYLMTLLSGPILLSSSGAFAQPCYTPGQCAQIRMNNDRLIAEQQAAQMAAETTRLRQEREAAREINRESIRQAAEQRQAQIEQERAQVQWRVEQARVEADALQRAQEMTSLRARQQADQQAAYEEQARRAMIIAENRAAAELAAENSPDNHCREQKIAGNLIDYFNGLQAASDFNARAVDIDHLSTVRFDADHQAISCHGSFILQNGNGISGTMNTRLNVAGRLLTEFHRD